MIRLGLMGCGAVADYGHVPAIKAIPEFVLASIYDPSHARVEAIRYKFGVEGCFTDAAAFLASEIDAVVVASPATAHTQNVLDAFRAGKHVLCEKPLASTPSEALRMIAAARRRGLLLFTAFDYRFSPVSLAIRNMVAQGAIGELRHLRFIYDWNLHGKYAEGSWGTELNRRRVDRMLEGGPMVDCGVHQIDLARFWTGSEVATFRSSGVWVDDYEAPDHVFLHMVHKNGVSTSIEMSFSYCHTACEPRSIFTYDAIGTDGVIHHDRDAREFKLLNSSGVHDLPFAGEKNFGGMYRAFLDALRARSEGLEVAADEGYLLASGRDGYRATRIALDATLAAMAARRGRLRGGQIH